MELVLGKWAILCASLNPADVFLGLSSVPLHFLLLIKDFVQHSWRLVVLCSPPPSAGQPLCKDVMVSAQLATEHHAAARSLLPALVGCGGESEEKVKPRQLR